jgi:hypothetical protein
LGLETPGGILFYTNKIAEFPQVIVIADIIKPGRVVFDPAFTTS